MLVSAGCGGGGSSSNSGPNADGVYTCSYNRGAGTVQIQIHDRNKVNIQVLDGAEYYNGSGTLNSQLHFSISCVSNTVPAKTIVVVGDITQLQDHTFQIAISITGAFTASGTGVFQVPSITAAFAGDYTGLNNGAFTGHWTMHIATNGDIHMQTVLNNQTYNVYGTLDGFYVHLHWEIPPGHGDIFAQFLLGPNNMKLVSGDWFLNNYDGHSNNAQGRFSGDAGHGG
ncbi:hypothetical protein [Fimbriimonas ginsengisoli]|nr:hypothetical protein [Fimbriimonas ginsengisoli]